MILLNRYIFDRLEIQITKYSVPIELGTLHLVVPFERNFILTRVFFSVNTFFNFF